MKKIFVATFLLMTIFFVTACGSEEPKKIIIGVDDEFPPIGFHDEYNNFVGFDVDLAKETAKRMGVDVEFKRIDWNKKREALTTGKIDLIWNGLDITDERKEYMIFTEPYMDDRQILLVRRGNRQEIYSEGDLEGKIVGIQSGATAEDYLNANAALKATLKECKTYLKLTNLINALKFDEIDVLICDELIARYEMNTNPDQFELLDVKIGSVAKMAVGFRKDDVELRDKVQKAFDSIVADGTAKKISEQWFNADVINSR